jgi:hypothetical protein
MNIMCIKNNKVIFYVFYQYRSKNTLFYKEEIFIPQNSKKKENFKIYDSFQTSVSGCCLLTRHVNII